MGKGKNIEYKNLVKHARNVLERAGIDSIEPEELVEEIYDPSLTYWENKQLLDEKLREITPAEEWVADPRILDETINQMQNQQDVEILLRELGDVLARIIVQRDPKEYPKRKELRDKIDVLLNSNTFHGLLVIGERGIGKSYNVRDILHEIAKDPNKRIKVHYLLNSTTHGLLTLLKEVEDKKNYTHVIVFEETTIFKNDRTKAIHLFNQLLDTSPNRTVRYVSKTTQDAKISDPIDVSNVKVIIISNEEDFGTDSTAEALQSRMLTFKYELTPKEKIIASYIAFMNKNKDIPDVKKRVLFAIYLTLLKNIAEKLPMSGDDLNRYQLISHAISNRTALLFAEYYKAKGLAYAIAETTKDLINLLAEYRDAGKYGWQTYRALHPTVSKRGYYRRRSVMENIAHIFDAQNEIGEIAKGIIASVLRAGQKLMETTPCHDRATTVPSPCHDRATFKKKRGGSGDTDGKDN